MALQTRKPTGKVAWPRILLEGTEKSGKSWALAELSASKKVGRTVVMVLGEDESKWDEFGSLPGVRFEIVVYDGSWGSILGVVEDAKEEARLAVEAGEPPMVFGFDTVSAEWNGLKDWASYRARNSKRGKALLAQDPDAVIDVPGNFWNDAAARHRAMMTHLLTFPGIVVLIARGNEVTLFENGQPVANKTTWSVDGHKSLLSDVTAHVRLNKATRPLLISSAGVHYQVRPGINPPEPLPDKWSLESLIFDKFGLAPGNAAVGGFAEMRMDALTPEQIRDEALDPATTPERMGELWKEAVAARYTTITLPNEHGTKEKLMDILIRAGQAKRAVAERAWVVRWRERLAAASTPGEAVLLRDELDPAFTARIIQLGTVGPLASEATRRERQILAAGLDPADSWLEAIQGAITPEDLEKLLTDFEDTFKDRPADDPWVVAVTAVFDLRAADLEATAGQQVAA